MTKVLVTGATGHLGYGLVRTLHERGYEVRASVRDPSNIEKTSWLRDLGVEVVPLDITNREQFIKAAEGVDGIFQVAAVFKFGLKNPEETIIRPNVEGALNSVYAAKENGVRRLVYTSSTVAVGRTEGLADESHWNTESKIPYEISKTRAEQKAWALSHSLGVDMVSLNPGMILGPYFNPERLSSSVNVIDQIRNRKIPLIPPFGFNIVDIRDLIEAHIMAFEKPEVSGRYIVTSRDPIPMADLIALVHKVRPEIKVPRRKISRGMFIAYVRATSTVAKLFGKIPQISVQQAREYSGPPSYYKTTRAEQELGFSPRSLEDTVAATLEWFDTSSEISETL